MSTDMTAARRPRRLRRAEGAPLRSIEPAALAGVMTRELTMYRRYWANTTFASVVEPTIYLLAFGFGFGSLVGHIAGYDYIDFIGTGVVATAVLFTSAFPGMFSTFVKRTFQHTYDAILAAPVDTVELVSAEALWIALKAGVYGCAPLVVAIGFGLTPRVGMLLVPAVAFVTGYGFAAFGIWVSALVPSIDSFNYVISAVLTPLFLVAGTFFPISALPGWASTAALANPVYHCVQLVRDAAFTFHPLADLGHFAFLFAFAALTWTIAVRRMKARLID